LQQYYCILLKLDRDRRLTVGALGKKILFPQGYYVYVGRAKKNIEARIERHARKNKAKRWHIDYLTTTAKIIEVVTLASGVGSECTIATKLQARGGEILVKGFGSSDCRCPSHLIYFSHKPSLSALL